MSVLLTPVLVLFFAVFSSVLHRNILFRNGRVPQRMKILQHTQGERGPASKEEWLREYTYACCGTVIRWRALPSRNRTFLYIGQTKIQRKIYVSRSYNGQSTKPAESEMTQVRTPHRKDFPIIICRHWDIRELVFFVSIGRYRGASEMEEIADVSSR